MSRRNRKKEKVKPSFFPYIGLSVALVALYFGWNERIAEWSHVVEDTVVAKESEFAHY